MNGHILKSVDHQPYLGVEIDRSLNFNQHIDNICSKANKKLGFVKRNLSKCPPNVKEIAYKSLVRPILEYAAPAWDPHTQTNIKKIEHIQRQAARWVGKCYDRTPGTVTNLLNDLKWQSLEDRRRNSRLVLFYKAINNQAAIEIPELVSKSLERSTRNLCKISSNSNVYKYSFFNQAVVDWNQLPDNVISVNSVEEFKSKLYTM